MSFLTSDTKNSTGDERSCSLPMNITKAPMCHGQNTLLAGTTWAGQILKVVYGPNVWIPGEGARHKWRWARTPLYGSLAAQVQPSLCDSSGVLAKLVTAPLNRTSVASQHIRHPT